MGPHHFRNTAVIAAALVLVGVAVSGQTSQQVQPGSDMMALVNEVKQLRIDLTRTAGVNARMQLLVARLSLQEQRITSLWRQLNELEGPLRKGIDDRVVTEDRVKQLESVVSGVPPERRAEVQYQLDDARRVLTRQLAREQELRTEVTGMAGQLTGEQSRWSEFNGRLDELERSLNEAAR